RLAAEGLVPGPQPFGARAAAGGFNVHAERPKARHQHRQRRRGIRQDRHIDGGQTLVGGHPAPDGDIRHRDVDHFRRFGEDRLRAPGEAVGAYRATSGTGTSSDSGISWSAASKHRYTGPLGSVMAMRYPRMIPSGIEARLAG